MWDSWTCVMVENGPGLLDEYICADLKRVACKMSMDNRDYVSFCEDVTEGYMETEWKTETLGFRTGILFKTQVQADGGEFKVNFLFSLDDLKRGAETLRKIEEGKIISTPGRGMLNVDSLYDFGESNPFPIHE